MADKKEFVLDPNTGMAATRGQIEADARRLEELKEAAQSAQSGEKKPEPKGKGK